MKVFLKGLNSCVMRRQKLKQYEEFLVANGHTIALTPVEADYILVWTCAFRNDAKNNSVYEVIRYIKDYNAKVLLAGCLPDIDPETVHALRTTLVIPWREDVLLEDIFGRTKRLEEFYTPLGEEALCVDVAKFRKEFPTKYATFQDQFIKIVVSEGCCFSCAYCSEKIAFPPYRSFPIDSLVSVCSELVKKTGRKEVMLLADSLGDYGLDNRSSLPELIINLSRVSSGIRFALNNLNPSSFISYYDEMITFIDKKMILHLNLPIQSASDKVLKLMNRTYNKNQLERIFSLLNYIGFNKFDTHVIVGFPGETESDLEETIDFILRHRFKYVLASAYMESPQMSASKLPGRVDLKTTQNRLKKLAEIMIKEKIIINTDEGDLSADKFRRLNRIKE